MRTQATIIPTFWTRGSGKKLRGDADAQVLALYLMTSPHSTMVGIYYSSLVTILDETGLTEARFRAALPKVSEIALYDEQEGLVYLPEGAAHQIGETLTTGNKIRKSVLSQLEVYGNHAFVLRWLDRYHEPYNLSHEGIKKPLQSPFDAPSMGHARVVHAPDPRSDPDPNPHPREKPESGAEPPVVASLEARAKLWVKDPMLAQLTYPDPNRWTEMVELLKILGETFGYVADPIRVSSDRGCRNVLARWAEGNDQARMRQAVRGSVNAQNIRDKPEHQTLATIFTDADCVSKYARLAKSGGDGAPRDKSNKVKLTPEAAEKRRKFQAGEF